MSGDERRAIMWNIGEGAQKVRLCMEMVVHFFVVNVHDSKYFCGKILVGYNRYTTKDTVMVHITFLNVLDWLIETEEEF